MIKTAITFANDKHFGQIRKTWNIPYVFHPYEVTYKLGKLGITCEATLCAAILHDVLEDTETSSQELFDNFGTKVQLIVEQLTCLGGTDKVEYIESFKDPDQTFIESLVIKLMDRACNIKDALAAGKDKWAKNLFKKGLPLWDALDIRGSSTEMDDVYGDKVANNICEYFGKQARKFAKL